MNKIILIQTGENIWNSEMRLDSLSGAPLSELGIKQISDIAEPINAQEPAVIYTSTGEAEIQTAKLIDNLHNIKIKTDPRLDGIDYGLWQGLTVDEIKRRQPSLYKQWQDSPASVRPPGGETLEEAAARIQECFAEVARKEKKVNTVGFIFRPIVFAICRLELEQRSLDDLWEMVDPNIAWVSYAQTVDSIVWKQEQVETRRSGEVELPLEILPEQQIPQEPKKES